MFHFDSISTSKLREPYKLCLGLEQFHLEASPKCMRMLFCIKGKSATGCYKLHRNLTQQQFFFFKSSIILTGTLPFALNAATLERSSSFTLVGTTRTAGYVSQSSYILLIFDIFQLSLGNPYTETKFFINAFFGKSLNLQN